MAIAEAASAVAKILHWIVGEKNPNDDLTSVGGRASALQVLLDPRARYRSLAAFARDAKPARLPKRNSPNSEAKCHADGWLNMNNIILPLCVRTYLLYSHVAITIRADLSLASSAPIGLMTTFSENVYLFTRAIGIMATITLIGLVFSGN